MKHAHGIVGGFVAAGVFALYASTTYPTVAFHANGEVATAALLFGVPHPSVSSLFLLAARSIAALSLPFEWARTVNLLNAAIASLAVLAVYAAAVQLYRSAGEDDILEGGSRIAPVAGAASAALFFAFTDTFWSAANAAGGAAPAMLLLALIVAVALRWLRAGDENSSSHWLLLLAFLFGLSSAVSPDLILAAPAVVLLVAWRMSRRHLQMFGAVTAATVLSVLLCLFPPGVVISFVTTVFSGSGAGAPALAWTAAAMGVALLLAGTVLSFMTGRSVPYFTALCAVLFLLGSASDLVLPMRAGQAPALNVQSPSTAERYGAARSAAIPAFDTWVQTGVRDRFLRYYLWNTVGRSGDVPGAPPVLLPDGDLHEAGAATPWTPGRSGYPAMFFGMPLLLAIVGLFRLHRHDAAAATFLLALFAATGPFLALFLPALSGQEQDGRFAGPLLVTALWVGACVAWGVAVLTRRSASGRRVERVASVSIAVAFPCLFLAFQALVARPTHDRSGDRVARDAAYNLLQSCDSNAVLFTEGDNDTYPLQYLQEALAVRRDVRVVNLGLLSEAWYCQQQIAQSSNGRPSLPTSFRTADIAAFARMDGDALARVGSPADVQEYAMPIERRTFRRFMGESMEGQPRFLIDSLAREAAMSEWTWRVRAPYPVAVDSAGDALVFAQSLRGLMVADIIRCAAWERPVYFSVFCADASLEGFEANLRLEGLAYRLTPVASSGAGSLRARALEAALFREADVPIRHVRRGFLRARHETASTYVDSDERQLADAYRAMSLRLAAYQADVLHHSREANRTLDACERELTASNAEVPFPVRFDLGALRLRAGDTARARSHFAQVAHHAWLSVRNRSVRMTTLDSPFRTLYDIARLSGDSTSMYRVLKALRARAPKAGDTDRALQNLASGFQIRLSESHQ